MTVLSGLLTSTHLQWHPCPRNEVEYRIKLNCIFVMKGYISSSCFYRERMQKEISFGQPSVHVTMYKTFVLLE